jgi:chloramphenicol O-acetyltransferase
LYTCYNVSDLATTQCYTNFTFAGVNPTNTSRTANCTYSIPINLTIINSKGRTFSYWINASNGQSTSGTGKAANSSVGRTLTGLSHNTSYQWNVTAVEAAAGTGDVYSQTYTFTTGWGGGTAPSAATPTPATGATKVALSTGTLSVVVTDVDHDPIRTRFYWSNGTLIGTDALSLSGETASISASLNLKPNTTYSWYVITNDSCQNKTSSTWTFTTVKANVSIEKEWHVMGANNRIICYLNISNSGEVNLTNVNITDTWSSNLVYGGANPINNSGVKNSWTIRWLNLSGYGNHWYNITLYLNLSGQVANGTSFTNSVTATVNNTVNRSTPSPLRMRFYTIKKSYTELLNWNSTSINWSINVTNSGNFYLHWVQVNETYSPNLTYYSSKVTPAYANTTFNITQIAPGQTYHMWILMNTSYIAGKPLVNGTRIWNNVTTDTNQTTPALSTNTYVYAGALTTQVRIHYHTQFTDVVSITNSVLTIIGMVIIIALLLGAVYIFYAGRGGMGQ